jgi:hypothetical protein
MQKIYIFLNFKKYKIGVGFPVDVITREKKLVFFVESDFIYQRAKSSRAAVNVRKGKASLLPIFHRNGEGTGDGKRTHRRHKFGFRQRVFLSGTDLQKQGENKGF